MNYTETLNWMFSQLPMYQRQGETAFKKDLTNSLALSKHLGFPEKKFKTIHVAGTNGKGSVSHMLASVLQEAGFKVGLYTSPHLKDFRERIKIDGKLISEFDVVNFIDGNKSFLEAHQLSFFEMTVGLAFSCFEKNSVDIAVVEVGLGGRLDSTNIITPEVSVITNIGLDHTQFLGETLSEIAFEKAGIIKKNAPVVIGEYQEEVFEVFKRISEENKSQLYIASKEVKTPVKTDLLGLYQQKNVKTAIQTIKVLNSRGYTVSAESLKRGLLNVIKTTGLLGRWQVLQKKPPIICDTGHNKEGLTHVLKQLESEKYHKLHIVLGVVDDKDLDTVLPMFPEKANYYFCKPNIVRGLDAEKLMLEAAIFNLKGKAYSSVMNALLGAKKTASSNDLIFVGGSTFVVAEIL